MPNQLALFGNIKKLPEKKKRIPLTEKFIIPPFSTFDTRQPYWIERKKLWRHLGIESEIGRQTQLYKATIKDLYHDDHLNADEIECNAKLSIFDPVLCEILYTWFCPENGTIFDPFAGGSVRGIVANKLGFHYTGIDLSKNQVEANRKQAQKIIPDSQPTWIIGDSQNLDNFISGQFDFVFSCPPYYNLEVYSDNENDLSNMPNYDDFLSAYELIIKKSVNTLKDHSFACFVVGEFRDKQGNYRSFIPDTIKAFEKAGAHYYNHAIILSNLGSMPARVSRQFNHSRKLGKVHQDIIVFVKGDSLKATEKCLPEDF